MSWRRLWVGVALVAVLSLGAMLLHPGARWLVYGEFTRDQGFGTGPLQEDLYPSGMDDEKWEPKPAERAMSLAAARYPDDAGVHTAISIREPNLYQQTPLRYDDALARLRAVMDRFPGSPVPTAAWLGLQEQALRAKPGPPPDRPQRIVAFIRSARLGERQEPGNAFFAMMEAQGLVWAGDTAGARKALSRAASMRFWNDHSLERLRGYYRIQTAAIRTANPFTNGAVVEAYVGSFPPGDLLKWSTALAGALERDGRTEEGILLRYDLLAVSKLSRQSGLSSGWEFEAVGLLDGAESRNLRGLDRKERNAERRAAWAAFLKRHGNAADVPWTIAQLNACEQAGSVWFATPADAPTSPLSLLPWMAPMALTSPFEYMLPWMVSNVLYGIALGLVIIGAGTRALLWVQSRWGDAAVSSACAANRGAVCFGVLVWAAADAGAPQPALGWLERGTIAIALAVAGYAAARRNPVILWAALAWWLTLVAVSLVPWGPILLPAAFGALLVFLPKGGAEARQRVRLSTLARRSWRIAAIVVLVYVPVTLKAGQIQQAYQRHTDAVLAAGLRGRAAVVGSVWPKE